MSGVLNLGEALSVNARLWPGRPAARDLARSLTYAQMDERTNRLANAFGSIGLAAGERVAIYAYNRLEWMELYIACAKAGVIAVPVNFRLTGEEVRIIIEDSGARALFAGADCIAPILGIHEDLAIPRGAYVQIGGDGSPAPGFRGYEDLLASGSARPPGIAVDPASPWTIMYTSGTTGRPKGAVRSHASYALFYLMNAVEFGFGRDDTGLCVMPLCHVNSVFYGFVFLYIGGSVAIYDRKSFDPEHLLSVLGGEGITFTSLVPTHYTMMLSVPDARRRRCDLSRVRNLLVSSAPARRETKLAIMEAFRRSSLFEAYGSTEAGLVTLLRPEDQFTKIGTIGREIVGTGRIRLLDPAGVEVPEGEVGELYARTPTSFDCYWNQPEASARAFQGCYCTASDMARRDPDGYYTLVDRKSNVIITGGEKVYPSEVEQVLITHPAVREIAVIGLADDRWGEAVTAVVVPHAGCAPEPGSLIRHARERLAGYKVPKAVLFIGEEDMPHTVTGKIVHRVLRERYANAGAGENSRSPERKVP